MLGLNDPGFAQNFGSNRGLPEFHQALQAHDVKFLAEDVGEATLRHTAMQRHLAAFKSADHAGTGTRALTFVSTGGRLAHARAHTAAHAFSFFRRLLWCSNVR